MKKTNNVIFGLDAEPLCITLTGTGSKQVIKDYNIKNFDFDEGTYYCYLDEKTYEKILSEKF